jgi:hypothetical protein
MTTHPGPLRPSVGDVVLDDRGYRQQCIATPNDRRHVRSLADTHYIFSNGGGTYWCVDQPEGTHVPVDQLTARERVRSVLLRGIEEFDWLDDNDPDEARHKDELYEIALIEAIIGADVFEIFGGNLPSHFERWLLLAEVVDEAATDARAARSAG